MTHAALSWGILGTGRIATTFAKAVRESKRGQLTAVASRSANTAGEFAKTHQAAKAYGSYEEILDDPDVEAVYVSLPNHLHAAWTSRLAEAGKHILCEKPLAMNHAEATRMIDAVDRADVFLMEAFMYRCHPQTTRLVELVRDGVIGTVRHLRAAFSYDAGERFQDIRYQRDWGGGAIMDVGCYCASMTRLIAGVANGQPHAEPVELHGTATIGKETQVDHWATACVKFPGNITATLTCGMQVEIDQELIICGSEGNLRVPNPWFPGRPAARILLERRDSDEPEVIDAAAEQSLYACEADLVAERLADRQAAHPAMTWSDTLGNMQLLDRWRHSVGVWFPEQQ